MEKRDQDSYWESLKNKEAKYDGFDLHNDKNKQAYYDAVWEEIEPSHHKNSSDNKKAKQSPNDILLVPGGCPNCQHSVQIRVRRADLANYSFTCPNCGQHITVNSQTSIGHNKDHNAIYLFLIAGSILGTLLAIYATVEKKASWSMAIAFFYNLIMISFVLSDNPKPGVCTRILAVLSFILMEGLICLVLYLLLSAGRI